MRRGLGIRSLRPSARSGARTALERPTGSGPWEVSAGKSFLLTTVFLWCLVEGIDAKAAAPTDIAAANVEIEGTQVSATTVHNLFDFNSEHVSQLDFSKVTQAKVAALIQLRVLLLDEVSMLDYVCFNSICKVLSDIDHCRRPDATVESDTFGSIHMVLFGDLKQHPPASSQAPFIVPPIVQSFDFRVLRQISRTGRARDLCRCVVGATVSCDREHINVWLIWL